MNYKINEKISKIETNLGVGNGVNDIGSSPIDRYNNIWAINFKGDSTAAYYADLAEKYTVNPEVNLPVGTVMEVSDSIYDAELCNTEISDCVIGIISAKPAFAMNIELENSAMVGLIGTLPIRVMGPVNKKDVLVTAWNGCLRVAVNDYERNFKVAVAFESDQNPEEKLIKCFLK